MMNLFVFACLLLISKFQLQSLIFGVEFESEFEQQNNTEHKK